MNMGKTNHTGVNLGVTAEQIYQASMEELNRADVEGRTLLHRAVRAGALDIVENLLARRVAVNAADSLGSTPLHEAIAMQSVPAIARLLSAGADVNALDAALRTPLCFAVQLGFADLVEMLLEHGADPNTQNLMGRTPLHEAVELNHFNIVTVLLRRRANLSIAAHDGQTPLDLAKKLGRTSMVDVMQRFQSVARPPAVDAPTPAASAAELERLRAELNATRQELEQLRQEQSTALPFAGLSDALLDAVPGSVYVLRPDGAFCFISASALRKLGVAREILLDHPWSAQHFPAQAAEVFDQRREEVLATGQPVTGVMQVPANGAVYGYRYTVAPVRGADDAIAAVLVVMHDDQGRAEMEERLSRVNYALHEAEMKLSRERAAREQTEATQRDGTRALRLLAALPVPVIVLAADGHILSLNPAAVAVAGFTEADVRGRYLWDALIVPDDMEDARNAIAAHQVHIPRLTLSGARPYTAAWTQTFLFSTGDALEYVLLTARGPLDSADPA